MQIPKNLFKGLFFVAGLVSLYIGINFFIDLHRYFQLCLPVQAHFENWEIEEVALGKYIVTTTYWYRLKEATYQNQYRIIESVYPNICLAKEHLAHWKESQEWVWVNPENPYQSTLFRPFPFKKGIHLVLSIGILFYFFWLSFYVHRICFAVSSPPVSE